MKIYYMLMFALALSSLVGAQSAIPIKTSFSAFNNWLPVITVALLLSVMIVGIYYMLGVILNNPSVKSRAISELGQVIGTAIIMLIILAALGLFGTSFSLTSLVSPQIMNSICFTGPNSLAGSPLALTNSGLPYATNAICNLAVSAGSSNPSFTTQLDYGLAASYVLLANLTNQSAVNLNSLYVFSGYVGSLSTLTSTTTFCFGPEGNGVLCMLPIPLSQGAVSALDTVTFSYKPLAGFSVLRIVLKPLETEANLIFESFVLQLLSISFFLYAWPFLLAAGIILRASFFTRRVGGLLIAMSLAATIFFPFVMLLEYSSLSNISAISPIGANSIPTLSIPGYKLNYYVFPNIKNIASANSCYPYDNSLSLGEIGAAAPYLVPFLGLGFGVAYALLGFVSYIPSIYWVGCTPSNALNTVLTFVNAYGVMSVAGFILPLINILLSFSILVGISASLGGDTNLLGIGRLV
ncbi:MAG: hypothetical protein QXW10_02865 [Candidatus Micrarchaeaceae archaeon]